MKINHYPFTAIVGQEAMKLGLILNVINPTLSGVLIRGEKGTSKSTAVRALAKVLPEIEVVAECPFQRGPAEETSVCVECINTECRETVLQEGKPAGTGIARRKLRVVELPLGSTEDRVVGTIDMEHALRHGEKRIEPGILAAAHRGFLYVDEVNLLDDHIVDVLLDAAAMGICTVEREGVSYSHPSRFVLVGTMNPEEGELRPQLLDRFGLCVTIEGLRGNEERTEVLARISDFERDPVSFAERWSGPSEELRKRISRAKEILDRVEVDRQTLLDITAYCLEVGVDGHRADIITMKCAKTIAAYEGRMKVETPDIERAFELSLPHRIRRQPFQDIGGSGGTQAAFRGYVEDKT